MTTEDERIRSLIAKWRYSACNLGLEGLASLEDCADELEAALSGHPEPTIDGYPLWSGLPPPVERMAMSDAEIDKHWQDADSQATAQYWGGDTSVPHYVISGRLFARAILSAQTDHSEDVRDMVTQSTDAENASKNAGEIVRLELICPKCQVDRLSQPCPTPTINDCWMMGIAQASTAPITQPMIAEAARDDVAGDAERFHFAISREDNAEALYAAVLSYCPDTVSIRREIDAAIAASMKDAP